MSAQAEQGATAAAGLVNLILAAIDPLSAAIFGIPSQALLAAGAGVFFGRTFIPSSGFRRTLVAWIGWTVASCYSLPLLLHFAGIPAGVVAGVSFALGFGLQLLAPVIVPVIVERAPTWFRSWADRFTGTGGKS